MIDSFFLFESYGKIALTLNILSDLCFSKAVICKPVNILVNNYETGGSYDSLGSLSLAFEAGFLILINALLFTLS